MRVGFVPGLCGARRRSGQRRICCEEGDGNGDAVTSENGVGEAAADVKSRRRGKPRLTVDERVMDKLMEKATEIDMQPSRLANFIIDTYLSEIERIIFGRRNAKVGEEDIREIALVDSVIVDDSVLYDARRLVKVAIMEAFAELHNLVVSLSEMEEFGDENEFEMVCSIVEKHNLEDADLDKLVNEADRMFTTKYATTGRIFPYRGAKSLLERLRNLGLRVFLTSMSPAPRLEAITSVLGLGEDVIDGLASWRTDFKKSPELQHVMEDFELDPERSVILTAGLQSLQLGSAAGVRTVGVCISHSAQDLEAAGADVTRAEPALVTIEDVLGAPLEEEFQFDDPHDQSNVDAEVDPKDQVQPGGADNV